MSETPIDDEYKGFMRAVFPDVHPESQQYRVMRDAFFAGAVAHHAITQKAVDAWDGTDALVPQGVVVLANEMRAFGNELAMRVVKPAGRG